MEELFCEKDNLTEILEELQNYRIARVKDISFPEDNQVLVQGTEIKFKKVASNGLIVKKIRILKDGRVFESPLRVTQTND